MQITIPNKYHGFVNLLFTSILYGSHHHNTRSVQKVPELILEEIKENSTKELVAIPEEEFRDCFKKWKHRWDKRIRKEGEYFEGNPN